ncbi:DUF3231 family protein [Paenibacillus caseinilyticus]|uniref:DUF3231 family protein n=1 Tax=Paenibacillus mucilaginosus K02 TaxID=997761 RepID=I0BE41_9BACL|nr:DUF3231 family protein [Paenibacillus mucilaginosus]AFH60638.1 hypothetical protein B2K_07880 [Paenibacillus mucilaginosus K02]
MNSKSLKLTSAEVGTLWGEFVNGTAVHVINKYMYSTIEDMKIKTLFDEAIKTFEKQKNEISNFLEKEGFPVPIGFNEHDLNEGSKRLFSDTFCLQYLHVMTLHGLLGHVTSLSASVRKDLRQFYNKCDDDGKIMYDKTIDLLLEKGLFQRDPYFFPEESPEYVQKKRFLNGVFGERRPLAATEIISLSFNIKKKILEKTLSIAFSQATRSESVRKFLTSTQETSEEQIRSLSNILRDDNLPVPSSWETEITSSTDSPFSDKLMLYHMGFLVQTSQAYHGAGLASAMRADLIVQYEKIILKNLAVTKDWFDLMTENQWLEQPPLAPKRKELANNR